MTRRFADMRHPINEPTPGGKLAVLLFILIVVIFGGLMLAALLASVSRMT